MDSKLIINQYKFFELLEETLSLIGFKKKFKREDENSDCMKKEDYTVIERLNEILSFSDRLLDILFDVMTFIKNINSFPKQQIGIEAVDMIEAAIGIQLMQIAEKKIHQSQYPNFFRDIMPANSFDEQDNQLSIGPSFVNNEIAQNTSIDNKVYLNSSLSFLQREVTDQQLDNVPEQYKVAYSLFQKVKERRTPLPKDLSDMVRDLSSVLEKQKNGQLKVQNMIRYSNRRKYKASYPIKLPMKSLENGYLSDNRFFPQTFPPPLDGRLNSLSEEEVHGTLLAHTGCRWLRKTRTLSRSYSYMCPECQFRIRSKVTVRLRKNYKSYLRLRLMKRLREYCGESEIFLKAKVGMRLMQKDYQAKIDAKVEAEMNKFLGI